MSVPDFRVGIGYDVHKLEEGATFTLGGIIVPHTKGAIGHSDADVLLHAITDALLGAANLGDIGQHFPDNDPAYKGIDSKILLRDIVKLIREKGFSIGNIDSTIALQKPKLKDLIPEMKKTIAETIGIEADRVSVKATTTEKLGFVGTEEGVAAYATCLLYKLSNE